MSPAQDKDPAGADEPKLLAGGNPQIPEGDGDAPLHFDEALVASRLEQASELPGWVP